MKIRAESKDVLYPAEKIVVVGEKELERLRRMAARSARARARLCAHDSTESALHEMFIVLDRAAYIPPHKHLGRAESFAVIEGKVDVVLFHDDGRVRKTVTLQAPGRGKNFYYRLSTPIYHTLVIRSRRLVFHETTLGPFRRDTTVLAPWAPAEGDAAAVKTFLRGLTKRRRG